MMYHSPFNALIANSAGSGQNLKYSGTLDDVLSDVATLSLHKPSSTANAKVWALHPPRIIRAVVDYKIQHPNSPEIEVLLREAIRVALGVYSDPTNSAETVGKLRDKIKTMGLEALLTSPLNQPSDGLTWEATEPARSQKTAQQLASQIQSNDVMVVALAHGGVAAGMDFFLRYCDISKSQDSAFYVARLSTQKLKDTQPRLSAREVNYLRKLAQGRQVVIFDEDSLSGTTLNIAYTYFSAHVFPNQIVIILSNLNMAEELVKSGFGKKLAEISESIDSDKKHWLIKKLYGEIIHNDNIIDYGLGDTFKNINYMNKKQLRAVHDNHPELWQRRADMEKKSRAYPKAHISAYGTTEQLNMFFGEGNQSLDDFRKLS